MPTAAQRADASVLRDTAKYCEEGRNVTSYRDGDEWVYNGACDILDDESALRHRFRAVFVEDEGYYLMAGAFRDSLTPEADGQECRILALCFAAAMAETGDL